MAHKCHAKGCDVPVSPSLLMCARHWRLVPFVLKRNVWAHYVKGQETTKTPTSQYLAAAKAAIDAVAELEGK